MKQNLAYRFDQPAPAVPITLDIQTLRLAFTRNPEALLAKEEDCIQLATD